MPKRIQRKRAKGWKMPENTVYVGRPSKWGNPYPPNKQTRIPLTLFDVNLDDVPITLTLEQSLEVYGEWVWQGLETSPTFLDALRGKDLACWCPLDQPCHADVLLELANRETAPDGAGQGE